MIRFFCTAACLALTTAAFGAGCAPSLVMSDATKEGWSKSIDWPATSRTFQLQGSSGEPGLSCEISRSAAASLNVQCGGTATGSPSFGVAIPLPVAENDAPGLVFTFNIDPFVPNRLSARVVCAPIHEPTPPDSTGH